VLCAIGTAGSTFPGESKDLSAGKMTHGFYWQRDERRDGKMIVYFYSASGQAMIQEIQACEKAGAIKP
jgi:hypothetical protein